LRYLIGHDRDTAETRIVLSLNIQLDVASGANQALYLGFLNGTFIDAYRVARHSRT
jgi:hypothetical protein